MMSGMEIDEDLAGQGSNAAANNAKGSKDEASKGMSNLYDKMSYNTFLAIVNFEILPFVQSLHFVFTLRLGINFQSCIIFL